MNEVVLVVVEGFSRFSGEDDQPNDFIHLGNKVRSPPSRVTHSFAEQRKNTGPSGVLNEKKLGRRKRLLRSACFFSRASEY